MQMITTEKAMMINMQKFGLLVVHDIAEVELISTVSCEREFVMLCGIEEVDVRFFTLYELKND